MCTFKRAWRDLVLVAFCHLSRCDARDDADDCLALSSSLHVYFRLISVPKVFFFLFTRQLAVEATECNAECLDCTHWIAVITSEHILVYSTELHDYIFN